MSLFLAVGCAAAREVSDKECNLAYRVRPADMMVGIRKSQVKKPKNAETAGQPDSASLSTFDLFKGLPDSRLQDIEEGSVVRDFRTGHYFFQTGEVGELLFLLEKGAVQTFRRSGTKKLIIAELKPPAVFGEMGCVGESLYHCCAQATEPSRVRMISRRTLDTLLEEHPAVTRRLLDLVSHDSSRYSWIWMLTSFRQLIPRLAKLLLEKAEGDFIRNMTHKDLRNTCAYIESRPPQL